MSQTLERPHAGEASRRKQLLSTAAAAKLLGISVDQFLRVAKGRRTRPEAWYPSPHRSGQRCRLWPPEAIRALVGGPEVAAAQERSRKLRDRALARREGQARED